MCTIRRSAAKRDSQQPRGIQIVVRLAEYSLRPSGMASTVTGDRKTDYLDIAAVQRHVTR
eukprot:4861789-Pleurochrysis_carterae.AAC.3